MDTNLKGAWLVARAAAKLLIEAKLAGSIINIASILGFRVAGHVAPYAASKAGLVQLTQALALEWARYRIRVNAIAPGYIETDLNRDFFASDLGKALDRPHPAAPAGPDRRSRRCPAAPRLRCVGLHDRQQHRGRRRPPPVDIMTFSCRSAR